MSFQAVKSYEPITQAQVNMIGRTLGPVSAMICRIADVDVNAGAGIIDAETKCLWTKAGHRIELSLTGGLVASCSKEIDPSKPRHGDI